MARLEDTSMAKITDPNQSRLDDRRPQPQKSPTTQFKSSFSKSPNPGSAGSFPTPIATAPPTSVFIRNLSNPTAMG
jgi:hypothetical protein